MVLLFRIFDEILQQMRECSPAEAAHWLIEAPEKLMLWTGRVDRHGQKIFDGDYVLIPSKTYNLFQSDGRSGTQDGIFRVYWDKDNAAFHVVDVKRDQEGYGKGLYLWVATGSGLNCEVIGNIHQVGTIQAS